MENSIIKNKPAPEDRPPIFQTWKQLYIFVLVMHAIIITLFYFFTEYHS